LDEGGTNVVVVVAAAAAAAAVAVAVSVYLFTVGHNRLLSHPLQIVITIHRMILHYK
jgi:ABC-type amino acid transport system permease subunit